MYVSVALYMYVLALKSTCCKNLEVAAWESAHLGKYPLEVAAWEKIFRKEPNIVKHMLFYIHTFSHCNV